MQQHENIRTEHYLDQFWCDRSGMYFQGWIHCYEHPLRSLEISIGGDSIETTNFSKRMDLLNFWPEHEHIVDGGFQIYVPSAPGEHVFFTVNTDVGTKRFRVNLPRREDQSNFVDDGLPPAAAFRRFVESKNHFDGSILELGSRSVSPGRRSLRSHFPAASKYIGVDIHKSANVDVVADAHSLSEQIAEQSIDALFSLSVIEHLQYPWLVAVEINRVLRTGGEVFINVPHSWPLHEEPNDFWRFSDEGLKVLFGPKSGFEILASGLEDEMRLYPENRGGPLAAVPLVNGYCRAYIHARKTRHVPKGNDVWELEGKDDEDRAKQYPRRN